MDAPPPGTMRPFVQIAALIEQAGLNAPRVLAQDVARGFLLLTDLGTRLPGRAERGRPCASAGCGRVPALMRDAFAAITLQWQRTRALPRRGAAAPELALFPEWCVAASTG